MPAVACSDARGGFFLCVSQSPRLPVPLLPRLYTTFAIENKKRIMAVTIATAANYWISPTALSITLNALGEANRIQASVASGSAIVCYIRGIDGLGYDNGHNYRRWPLAIMPTYFSTNDEIYLYVAIPRSAAVGTDALVVFPDKKLDIYGYEVITNPDTGEETQGTQYGTDDYYYIWLQGIITSSGTGYTDREWRELMQTGTLATDEAIDSQEGTWYRWDPVSQTVTFLKEILMDSTSWFRNLIARSFTLNGTTLNGVAIKGETPTDSDDTIVTPAYLDGFGSEKYLRKDQDDSTPYSLGVGGTLRADGGIRTGEIRSNNYTGDSIGDSGYLLTADYNGHSKLTIDEIYVRMKAVFESLEVKKWTVSAGDEIRSCAANIINRTEYLDGSGEPIGYSDIRVPWLLRGIPFILSKFNGRVARKMYASIRKVRVNLTPEQLVEVRTVRCYFLANDGETEIQNWWHVNDLVRCQTMNIVNTQRNTYTGTTTHVGNVFWWRKCKGVSTEPVELEHGKKYHYIDIAYDKTAEDAQSASIYCLLGSDIPAAGDHMVQFGNTIEPGRMNLWIQMVNGGSGYDYDPNSDAPCIKGFKGIYTFDLSKCWYGGNPCKMTLSPGNKYHFYGEDFRVIKEYGEVPVATNRGLWTSITPERDDYSPHAQVRKCYYYDEVSHKGCLWRCAIADGQHWTDASGNYISDSAYAALSDEEKVLCTRRPNYTTDEPSESSLDWVKTVDRGLSPVQIFRWYLASVTTVPTPSGTTGSTIPPSGWSTSAPNRPGDAENVYNLWMSIGDKDYQGLLVGEWSTPVRISGDKGTAGEDASDVEWIYTRNNTGTTPDTPPNPVDRTIDDYVPSGWTDNPQGVDYNHKYEYASFRQKSKGHNQTWGDFQRPVLWSHWGTNGMDGDGVEYVFMRTTENTPPKISSSQSGYDTDEYLPSITNRTDCGAESTKCTDDPKGTNSTYKYEWAAKRTKADPDPVTGVRPWNKYPIGDMALWANWSKDGASSFKSTMFVRMNATPTKPAANAGSYANPSPSGQLAGKNSDNTNVYWSDGIPVGSNILWATTRIFSSDGNDPQQAAWSEPRPMTDTSTYDVEFSAVENPGNPTDNPSNWHDPSESGIDFTQMIWMAERSCENGVWSQWAIIKIKGEKGNDGNGIVSITCTFAISNVGTVESETTEPAHYGGWTTGIPVMTDTYPYLWRREVIVFTDATKNTTKYYCMGSKGDKGATVRGPRNWSASVTYNDGSVQESDGVKYIDIVLYNGSYYRCLKSASNRRPDWYVSSGYWVEATQFDFVATNLLLANYAKINNLGAEAIEMEGSNGEKFTAKAGSVYCNTGTFENVEVHGTIYADSGEFKGDIIVTNGTNSVKINSSGFEGRWGNDGIRLNSNGLMRWHPDKNDWVNMYGSRYVRVVNTSVSLTDNDDFLICAGSDGYTVTLPAGELGKIITIRNVTGGTIRIIPKYSWQKIWGDDEYTAVSLNYQDRAELVFYNNNWYWNAMSV